jgi:hypothetical protein
VKGEGGERGEGRGERENGSSGLPSETAYAYASSCSSSSWSGGFDETGSRAFPKASREEGLVMGAFIVSFVPLEPASACLVCYSGLEYFDGKVRHGD